MMKKIFIAAVLFIMVAPTMLSAQGCVEASSDEGVQVVGYLQSEFKLESSGELGADESFSDNSFYFNRARIGVVGNIPYNVSYYVMAELSPSKDGPYILDAFISYTFNKWAKISVGQFKTPFGLELSTPCQSLHTVNRSEFVNKLAHPFRDQGIMFSGKSGDFSIFGLKNENLFSYSFAVLNGTGLNQEDKDKYKDIAARIVFAPIKELAIGTSYRTGKAKNSDPAVTDADERTRFGVDLSVDYKNFLFQAEYIKGEDVGSVLQGGGGCGEPATYVPGSEKSEGYMAQLLYMTPYQLQPVVKYEVYNKNINASFDKTSALTFGFNYFINEWTRVQVNYIYNVEESSEEFINDYNEIPNDMLLVQLQVRF